jgi:hypothetical protein
VRRKEGGYKKRMLVVKEGGKGREEAKKRREDKGKHKREGKQTHECSSIRRRGRK